MKTGAQLRDRGIALVSAGNEDWLYMARSIAAEIATSSGTVTINDLRERVELPEELSPNLWGAVFRSGDFEPVGYTQATHPSAHARVVRIYKLKGLTQ
jgi:hypothetical protein